MKFPELKRLRLAMLEANFDRFTQADWDSFAGAVGENPLIAHTSHGTLILDDERLSLIWLDENDDEFTPHQVEWRMADIVRFARRHN